MVDGNESKIKLAPNNSHKLRHINRPKPITMYIKRSVQPLSSFQKFLLSNLHEFVLATVELKNDFDFKPQI